MEKPLTNPGLICLSGWYFGQGFRQRGWGEKSPSNDSSGIPPQLVFWEIFWFWSVILRHLEAELIIRRCLKLIRGYVQFFYPQINFWRKPCWPVLNGKSFWPGAPPSQKGQSQNTAKFYAMLFVKLHAFQEVSFHDNTLTMTVTKRSQHTCSF
jgi:hypothetical protein